MDFLSAYDTFLDSATWISQSLMTCSRARSHLINCIRQCLPCRLIASKVVDNGLVIVIDDEELAKLSSKAAHFTFTIKFVGVKHAYMTSSPGSAQRVAPTQRDQSISSGPDSLGNGSPTSSPTSSTGSSAARRNGRGQSLCSDIHSPIASTPGSEDVCSGALLSTTVLGYCQPARHSNSEVRSQPHGDDSDINNAPNKTASSTRDDIDSDGAAIDATSSSSSVAAAASVSTMVRDPVSLITSDLTSSVSSSLVDATLVQDSPTACHPPQQPVPARDKQLPNLDRDQPSVSSCSPVENGDELHQSASAGTPGQDQRAAEPVAALEVLEIRNRLATVWAKKRETKAFREQISQLELSSSNLDDFFNFQPDGPDFLKWLVNPNMTTEFRREIEIFRLVYLVDLVEKIGQICVPNFVDFATSGYTHLSDLYPFLRLDYKRLDPKIKSKWQDSLGTSLRKGFVHRQSFRIQPATALTISAEILRDE